MKIANMSLEELYNITGVLVGAPPQIVQPPTNVTAIVAPAVLFNAAQY
jgi:hypothetical protein